MKYKSLVLNIGYQEIVAVYCKEQETVKIKIGDESFWRYHTEKNWFTRANLKEWIMPQLISRIETLSRQLDQIRAISLNEEY